VALRVSSAPGLLVDPTRWLHLDWILLVIVAWLLIGVAGVFALRRLTLVARVLFPAGGAFGLCCCSASP
jgi:hydrogenase-4 component B